MDFRSRLHAAEVLSYQGFNGFSLRCIADNWKVREIPSLSLERKLKMVVGLYHMVSR